MAEHGRISVILNGNKVQTINRAFLGQSLFEHNSFEISLPLSTLVKVHDKEDPFPAIKNVIGKDVEIKFGVASSDDEEGENESSLFKGLVKDVSVHGKSWEHASVSIKGFSPTVLIDGIEGSRAYAEKNIADIYNACTSDHLSSKIELADNLVYSDKLPFTVQWNETEFNFIGRLCQEFGEWFYYDGEKLNLGLNTSAEPVTLKKNRVRSLQFDYSIVPGVPGLSFRDYNSNEVKQVAPKSESINDDMAEFSASESKNLFSAEGAVFRQSPSFASGDKMQSEEAQIEHYLKVNKGIQTGNVLTVSGETDVASIKLGGTIRLEGFQHSGDFTVISLSHNSIDAKSYSNSFVAIPKGSSYPRKTKFKTVELDSCLATVTDNKDPKKWGRVRVKFDWFQDVESPWVRVLSHHAGDARGTYFVPEIGEEVMVGFEQGDPRHPYIMGSMYNGKNYNDEAYDDKNNFKVIKTRSGNEILFDDTGRMVFKNNHNLIELNCSSDGTITIKTDGDIEIEAGKNMKLIAGEKMLFQSGKNMQMTAGTELLVESGESSKIEVGDKLNVEVKDSASINSKKEMTLESQADLKAVAQSNFEISAMKNGKVSSMNTKVEGSTSAELSAAGNTTVKGAMVKIN